MNTRQFLLESGICPNVQGFHFIIKAVEYAKELASVNKKSIMQIYDLIAVKFDTKPIRVERAIRYVLQTKIPKEMFCRYGIKPNATNSEFIYYCADADNSNIKMHYTPTEIAQIGRIFDVENVQVLNGE